MDKVPGPDVIAIGCFSGKTGRDPLTVPLPAVLLIVVLPGPTFYLLSSLTSRARHECADNRSGDVPRTKSQSALSTVGLSYWVA